MRTCCCTGIVVLAVSMTCAMGGCEDRGIGGGPIQYESWYTELWEAQCAKLIECETDTYSARFGGDVGTCTAWATAMLGGQYMAHLEELIAEGRVFYDADAARECVEALTAASCGDLSSPAVQESCYQLLQGTRDGGEPCTTSMECVSGVCEMDVACPGTCMTTAGLGGDCTLSSRCEADLICELGTCQEPAPPAGLGEPCEYSPQCDGNLFCDASTSTCSEPVGEGQFCDDAWACAAGLYCSADDTCAAMQTVGTAGAPCDPGESQYCDLSRRLGCTYTVSEHAPLTCAPLRAEGDPCVEEDPDSGQMVLYPCDPLASLYCDNQAVEPTCLRLKEIGEPCVHGGECFSMACSTDGVCDWMDECVP